MVENLSSRVKLGRYEVLEELDKIFAMSKGLRLKDLLKVVCEASSLQLEFNIGNLEVTFDNYGLFREFDEEDEMITMSLEFENEKEKEETAITRNYFYSVKELEGFIKAKRTKGKKTLC